MNILKLTALVVLMACATTTFAQGQRGEGPKKPSFSEIDSDGNGAISYTEFSAKKPPHGDAETIFNEMDANSDGSVSEEELESFKPPRPQRNDD